MMTFPLLFVNKNICILQHHDQFREIQVAIVTPVIHYCMGGLEIDADSRVVKKVQLSAERAAERDLEE